MENSNKFSPSSSTIFGLKGCIEFTGLAESTIRKYMSKSHPDRIPYWKKGGKVLFDMNEVEKWLRNESK